MLTLSEYKNCMEQLNKLNINPYVRVRKGSKVDGKEQALVYLDQRDVFSLLNEAFGVGYWQSEEWVAADGKSVGASIKFPVMLSDGTVYTYIYSSVADLIVNTKKIKNVTIDTLVAANIPLVYNGWDIVALDMEEAVKGAASRALVRAATKFMRSIANLYNYKGLFYTANGQKPDLSKINFNAPELGHQDDDETVVENVVPIAPTVELANLALINQLVEVATQLEKDSKKKMQLVIDTINHIAEELGETPPTFDTSSGGAFKKALSELVDAEGLTLVIEQLKAKLEPAKPAKASKSDPKA